MIIQDNFCGKLCYYCNDEIWGRGVLAETPSGAGTTSYHQYCYDVHGSQILIDKTEYAELLKFKETVKLFGPLYRIFAEIGDLALEAPRIVDDHELSKLFNKICAKALKGLDVIKDINNGE